MPTPKPKTNRRMVLVPDGPRVFYTTRRLPSVFRDRIRILAVLRRRLMEEIVNEALAIGLAELERQPRE